MGVSARARSIPDMVSNCLMFVILEAKKDDNSTDDCDTWAGVMTLDGKKGIDKNREAHFGIAISQSLAIHRCARTYHYFKGAPWQDKGFGTQATEWIVEYAFEQLGIHRVSLGMMASNERALALYKKW
jgi:RimJ/RimL family protein N-acetyltransferase